jgi:microcystin-dependent protein
MSNLISDTTINKESNQVITSVSNQNPVKDLNITTLENNYLITNTVNVTNCLIDTCEITKELTLEGDLSVDQSNIPTEKLLFLKNLRGSIQQQLDDIQKQIYTIQTLPPGTIIDFVGSNPTSMLSNYLVCDGQQYSKVTYQNLYLCIGDTYNQLSNQTDVLLLNNFRVPDLRGAFTRNTTKGENVSQTFYNSNREPVSQALISTPQMNGKRYASTIVNHEHSFENTTTCILNPGYLITSDPNPVFLTQTTSVNTDTMFTYRKDGNVNKKEGQYPNEFSENVPPHILTIKLIKF